MADTHGKPPKPGLNYIQLINQFWRVKRAYNLTSNQSLLYLGLLDKCNSLSWKNPFRESERYLSKSLNISVNTIRKDRQKLVECGMIRFYLPEKASKSVEGSATYFIIENIPTASTTEAVEEIKNTPTASTTEAPTASTTEAQPLQNSSPTASTVAANIKPSTKNLQKTSFFKDEIKKIFDSDQLKQKFNNLLTLIKYNHSFKGMDISGDEYISYLQNYYPEEIEGALREYSDRAWEYSEDQKQKSIGDILNLKLPAQRQNTEKTINNAIKGCEKVLQMPGQLTTYEKINLLKHADYHCLKDAFSDIEDNANYRKGDSVFLAVKKNLKFYDNWK